MCRTSIEPRTSTRPEPLLRDELASVCVIIPANNEEAALPLVLEALPRVGRVVVVDNASTDATAEVARRHGAAVVREERLGYGSACLAGLAYLEAISGQHSAGSKRADSDDLVGGRKGRKLRVQSENLNDSQLSTLNSQLFVVVFLDADYSDFPERMAQLVEPILAGEADFVLGSRLLGRREPGAMPPWSVWGNRLACLLMRVAWGARYTDLGPFRAIRYDALKRLRMEDRNFGWTVEMQIKAVRAGLRIREIPVPYRRRVGTSKISGTVVGSIKAGAKILYTLGKYGWKGWWSKGRVGG